MNTAGNKIVTCSLGSGLNHHGSFDFDKAVFVKVITCYLCELMTNKDILHDIGTTKVEISVLESEFFIGLAVFNDFKRRCKRFTEDFEFAYINFNISLSVSDNV